MNRSIAVRVAAASVIVAAGLSSVGATPSLSTRTREVRSGPAQSVARQARRSDVPCSLALDRRQRITSPVVPAAELRRLLGAVPDPAQSLGAPCSSTDWAAESGTALVEAVATSTRACLEPLWTFDADVAVVISAANVTAVVNRAGSEAVDVLANVERLDRLIYLYQIAAYHEFYEGTIDLGAATKLAAQQALSSIAANPDFFDEGQPVKDLRRQWTISIDGADGTHLELETVRAILKRYRDNPALSLDYYERVTAYYCLFSISRQIFNRWLEGGDASSWYGLLDIAFVDLIAEYAQDTGYTYDSEYLVANGIWTLGQMSYLDPATVDRGHMQISQAYAIFPQYVGPWLWSVGVIDAFYSGVLYDGRPIDMEQIQADVMAIALPNEFVLDEGRLVFRTAVTPSTVAGLFDAIQEVESQFFRKGGYLDETPGDTNEILTLVIYGSPQDYALYQPFLFNLPTDNGGIYIEGDGTLYTYDRTPQQSVYTLEELLRHEVVHYLDSRYLITPTFGEYGSLYDDGRLVWYNEGLAEFLVGSTRVQGVLPRGGLLREIDHDAERLTVSDIIDSNYGSGFRFYSYAGMFFEFLETQRSELLIELFDAIRGDDKAVVDVLYGSMAGDPLLQADYDAYLTAQIDLYNTGQGLFAEDVPTTPTPPVLPENNATGIRGILEAQLPTAGGQFRVHSRRFRYTDVMTVPVNSPPEALSELARQALDDEINGALLQLEPLGANFSSAVGWFGNVSFVGDQAVATYVVEGPYSATRADDDAPDVPSNLVAIPGVGRVTLHWDDNIEDDINGYRVYRATARGGPVTEITTVIVPEPAFIDENVSGNGTVYRYVVTAVDASGNESDTSFPVKASSTVGILLVNGYLDDDNTTFYAAFADSLGSLDLGYETWDVPVEGEVPQSVLTSYADGVVIWSVGYYSGQLSRDQLRAIESYLDAGGNFVFSGAFKASNLDRTSLFTNYLHATHVGFNINLNVMNGVVGSPVGDGLDLTMGFTGYESEVAISSHAEAAFVYDPDSGPGTSSGVAAFTVDAGYKVVYLAFPFKDVGDSQHDELLGQILAWTIPEAFAPPPLLP